ncbi:MAG: carboxymuconolactone decarboxylase family protein [Pseudonocardia sp.]|nr:carboxymuconolactone decarboxylase family protein [Pseudonocardia sp.]MBO0872190.1 carboxymuconolactone decarboxylase family protein [Pseudonocardia sp.]
MTAERARTVFGRPVPAWDALAEADPEFAEAYTSYLEATWDTGVFEPRIRELLLLAHDASMTVLDADGIAARVRRARQEGASEREVLDVLEMLALISIHSLTTGLPMLYGAEEFPRPEQAQGRYWDDFEARVPGFNGMLAHALPGVFTAYRRLGRTLWRPGGLAPKWRELALVVADLSTTHLYRSGAALHIRAAIRHGATREEIAAAIALAVPSGARTLELGITALTAYAEESTSGQPDREQPSSHDPGS